MLEFRLADMLGSGPGMVTMPKETADALAILRAANDASPVAISVVDLRQPDQPLVYVNQAFERVTGYSRAMVVGRNCRLLQGKATDKSAVSAIREAIKARMPADVLLTNYRLDGTSFRNRLMLNPVRDYDGEVFAYVGHQFTQDFFESYSM